MICQLSSPLPPSLAPSQDVAVTQLSACDSSAVTPSECVKDSQVFRVQLARNTTTDEAASSKEITAPVSSQDDVRGDES
ncbi:hypothetical protein GN958_ATG18183 [Phytophthora infestans]|nr:hypothetical protein GN958_ATG18183 [Phytophthora infestans]